MEEESQKDEASNPGEKRTEEKVTRGNGQRKNRVANEKERGRSDESVRNGPGHCARDATASKKMEQR